MGKTQPLPILITGGGRRIGLALAWHFINQKQPVIVSDEVLKVPMVCVLFCITPARGWRKNRVRHCPTYWLA